MRKLTTVTVLILALAMCFALSACGAPSEPPEPSEEVVQTPSPAPSEEVAQTPSPAPSEEPAQTPSAPAENNAKPQMLKLNIGSASSVSVLHRSGNTVYITDEAVIRRITDNFNTPSFYEGEATVSVGAWVYSLEWVAADGQVLCSLTVVSGSHVFIGGEPYYTSGGSIDVDYLESLFNF